MDTQALESRQYFLGIGGQQTGPFSELEIQEKIQQNQVPADSLIWYEGLAAWQPIKSIDYFKDVFEGGAPKAQVAVVAATPAKNAFKPLEGTQAQSAAPRSAPRTGAAGGPMPGSSTFADGDMRPIFRAQEAVFHRSLLRNRNFQILVGTAAFLIAAGGIYYLYDQLPVLLGITIKDKEVVEKPVVKTTTREVELRKALSELLLAPTSSIQELVKLAHDNPQDKVGDEALKAVIGYYKQVQRPLEAGRLLMEFKHPSEAAALFLQDPPAYKEAETALFSAYQVPNLPNRRDLLMKDIKILLGPLADTNTALERIRLLEKDFPGQPHPYQYYTKSTEDRITDLFSRLSFSYVQNLMGFIAAEMPQLNLKKRPLVELKRDAQGNYRLVGSYRGEVQLNQDTLPNVSFVFWQFQDNWFIADTNVTPERQRYAKGQRERHLRDAVPANEMLNYLQVVFKTQFPRLAIHESVSASSISRKNEVE